MNETGSPLLQASKWLQLQALIDVSEMASLLEDLDIDRLYFIGRACKPGEEFFSREVFLEVYGEYVDALKQGRIPIEARYRPFFSSALSRTNNAFHLQTFEDGRCFLRPVRPVIQCQVHRLGYSSTDGKFRPMVLGNSSIDWGIQFSYPQLFQDPRTKIVSPVGNTPEFPDTALFKALQRWMRAHTIPTPFFVEGKKINVSMRLGKECLPWINRHPQLIQQHIQVIP